SSTARAPAAALVKSRLLLREKDPAGARAVLEEAAKANPADVRVLTALGKLCIDTGEPEQAASAFEAVCTACVPETEVLDLLAKCYAATKSDKLAGALADLADRVPDNLDLRLRLAKLHAAAGRHAEAERWAREVLFVDVASEEAKEALVAALRAQKKDAEADAVGKRYRP
ncbi:MAG TPA: tetratricopeptide repeat protein, partial [Gemmata sp.]|nr:tetratricopeptide repeat protein [Gemmata sp.]